MWLGWLLVAEVMGYEVDEAGVRERVKKILERQDHCLLVAKEGDEVIGFCHGYVRLLVEVGEAVEIGGLAVKEEHQGKGVAKQLIVAMEAWVREIGQDWVVLSSNVMRVKAHGFYEHMGYEKSRQQFAFEKRLAELLAGRAATVKGPDGVETSVLEVGVTGLSEGGHDGIMLTKMQFDAPTIYSLIKKAVESGIIGQQPSVESNWAPGGKMEQMTNFAISLAQRSS
jgi:GNAT superfamily N-acetyltransferase